jgi:hypothetical protein
MICVAIEDFSPSQIGMPSTRMSPAITRSKICGQSSCSQPCSVMSGQTPVAIRWSIARMPPTVTSLRRMISIEMSIRPWVCETSGLRLSVQLIGADRCDVSLGREEHGVAGEPHDDLLALVECGDGGEVGDDDAVGLLLAVRAADDDAGGVGHRDGPPRVVMVVVSGVRATRCS